MIGIGLFKRKIQAACGPGLDGVQVSDIGEAFLLLKGEGNTAPEKLDREAFFQTKRNYEIDFNDVKGQAHAKRAMEVAMAGNHNSLVFGP